MIHADAIATLVLDLEGTLISNAVSQVHRPGRCGFLEGCGIRLSSTATYNAVGPELFRVVAVRLVEDGHAPAWLRGVEHLRWTKG